LTQFAGDFDLEEPAQLSVIQSLALAYREFNLKYDELTVDEAARAVEMHRPDGVPDTVQEVKHGALLILAQFHNIGHAIRGTHEPDLRQYTHLGDGATKTDGRIYDPKLGASEAKGDYSGKPDDRWIFTSNNSYFQWNAIAALAAAADTRQRPSLCNSQVGSCNYCFGTCSAFTHVTACTLAESPCDPLHRKLRQLRCLRCRFDCYRVERTSSRAGVAPAEVQRLFTAHFFTNNGLMPFR
jgi:hypothetical protein